MVESKQVRPPNVDVRHGGHWHTLLPFLFRQVSVTTVRQRISTPDDDFLDLDWAVEGHKRLAILCHGLEGNSQSQYMRGMVRACHDKKWDALAINFRSCSGEINKRLHMYHHGETGDLQYIVDQVVADKRYAQVALVGFSLGGNVILKYLGTVRPIPEWVIGGAAISVPGHLASSAAALDEWQNQIYSLRFRLSLRKKLKQKNDQYPGVLPLHKLQSCKTWYDFDNTFTTIINSFKSADEYYAQGSANNFLKGIERPSLIINALNDPFLRPPSYPFQLAQDNAYVHLKTPAKGGHVGFWYPGQRHSYAEEKSLSFFEGLST